jgi:hypothetical protein
MNRSRKKVGWLRVKMIPVLEPARLAGFIQQKKVNGYLTP